jgi:hypothetical protein
MNEKMVGEKALCDLAKQLIGVGEKTKYQFIEITLESFDLIDEKGTRILKMGTDDTPIGIIKQMLPDFKKMVHKRNTPTIIVFNSEIDYEIVQLNKYDGTE